MSMAVTVLPSSWHCLSLHVACVVIATCSIALYALAVGLELWWIVESEVRLPIPADALCAVYIVHLLNAIFLAVGLAGKKTRILLSCLVILSLFYFVEGALVLCMIIMHWTLTNKYGIIELVLWIVRAIYNVVAFLTVLSQYATWRDEKQVMMRLHCLTMNGGVTSAAAAAAAMKKEVHGRHHRSDQQFATSVHHNHHHQQQQQTFNGHVTTAGSLDDNRREGVGNAADAAAYDNLAYSTTVSDLTLNGGGCTTTGRRGTGSASSTVGGVVHFADDSDGRGRTGRMKRSLSSASQIRLHRSPSLYGGSLPVNGQELTDPMSGRQLHHLNPLALSYGGSTKSEFDASSFSGIFSFPVRSQSELSLTRIGSSSRTGGSRTASSRTGRGTGCGDSSDLGHKPRSLMYLDEDDYLARPPPSRPVSMGYVNVNQREFVTQSLDRPAPARNTGHPKRGGSGRQTPRRAASLEAISDVSEMPGVKLQKLAMRPFDYLERPGSMASDLNVAEHEADVRKIQDVAL